MTFKHVGCTEKPTYIQVIQLNCNNNYIVCGTENEVLNLLFENGGKNGGVKASN